ncbi:MAG: hypothetical protein Q8R35_02325 [bacterium]|nr:hypothetical protein [bacterium]
MRGLWPRDKTSGRLRKKRSDTKVGTLERKYGRNISTNSRLQLGTLLKRRHKKSLKSLFR